MGKRHQSDRAGQPRSVAPSPAEKQKNEGAENYKPGFCNSVDERMDMVGVACVWWNQAARLPDACCSTPPEAWHVVYFQILALQIHGRQKYESVFGGAWGGRLATRECSSVLCQFGEGGLLHPVNAVAHPVCPTKCYRQRGRITGDSPPRRE